MTKLYVNRAQLGHLLEGKQVAVMAYKEMRDIGDISFEEVTIEVEMLRLQNEKLKKAIQEMSEIIDCYNRHEDQKIKFE